MYDGADSAPFFLVGHSMGGGILALIGDTVRDKYGSRFGGGIFLSAALAGPPIGGMLVCVLRMVACLWPTAPLGPPEDPYCGFATKAEAARYAKSPHNYMGTSGLQNWMTIKSATAVWQA
jgi:alpha-beta hydrolase superfamily lysophospholipase